ncbi:uncharacterized protein LOC107864005 isoform X2 [Capsicum annuum]|uniref:uncharacterized protein LOC107864005 isoform X2 n=1 Tax=Capsicum annuum TaxID=4072 RepID=UPI001FB08068|nr:uncharacterized protein LOC107864005 isoform X2 [Capsicum annuum]
MEEEGSATPRAYLQENEDSDQSITEEEEDMDDKWMTNDNCLSGSLGNKRGIGVLSQLELLKGIPSDTSPLEFSFSSSTAPSPKGLHHSTDAMDSHQMQRQTGLCKEDDVEVPFFKSQDGGFINKNDHWMALSCYLDDEFCHVTRMTSTCNSEEEIISDDEMRPSPDGNLKRDGKSTMPKVSSDCKSGIFFNKDAGCSSLYCATSKSNRSSKGRSGKAKPKFLFQSQPQKKDFALVVHESCESSTPLSVLPLNAELDMQRENIESLDDLLENHGGNEVQQFEENSVPSEVAVVHDPNEHSMAEVLDHFQHTSSVSRGNSKMLQTKRQGSRFLQKRNLLLLGDRNMSNDDQPEELDSDPSSDENKVPQILKSAIPQRTMAEKFHLALGAVSTNERLSIARPKQLGLSGRLQHVMQCEKDRDTYFLEKSQTRDSSSGKMPNCVSPVLLPVLTFSSAVNSDAESFIDVRILSSSLEAKLTVCFCAVRGDEEGSECLSNLQKGKGIAGRKLTIIFNSRICKDVELETGNVIRIHQPWKEIHVNEKDEAIILCAYFSQI